MGEGPTARLQSWLLNCELLLSSLPTCMSNVACNALIFQPPDRQPASHPHSAHPILVPASPPTCRIQCAQEMKRERPSAKT